MGGWEWAILGLIALLLIGGSRLGGIGRNAGRAVRAFSEETAALRAGSPAAGTAQEPFPAEPEDLPDALDSDIVDAELISPEPDAVNAPGVVARDSGDAPAVSDKD